VFPVDNDGLVFNSNVGPPGDTTLWSRLSELAEIYIEMRRFSTWIRANLTPDTGPRVPRYTFATLSPTGAVPQHLSFYNASSDEIFMGIADSVYTTRDGSNGPRQAPENAEWHEFAHHLHRSHMNSSGAFVCPDGEPPVNHAGWVNQTTCDSLIEGFAEFLPTLVDGDPIYANNMANLEDHTKAWHGGIAGGRTSEDIAVAALLRDLVDPGAEFEDTLASILDGLPVPVLYDDRVGLPIATLWQIFKTHRPKTVLDLYRALVQDAGGALTALSIDLDGDGTLDVSRIDQPFLMHGFFPVIPTWSGAPRVNVLRYDINAARLQGRPPNNDVGLSSHYRINYAGEVVATLSPRSEAPILETSNLAVAIADASGTPLTGAALVLTVEVDGSETVSHHRLPTGEDDLVHLELPQYFESYLPEGAPLPACDPATDRPISVTARATLNGYASGDEFSIDGCAYWHAVAAAQGDRAVAFALGFPEDSTPPVSSILPLTSDVAFENWAVGAWTVEVSCQDPVSDFASGCRTSEYSLDGAPFAPFAEPVEITAPGLHSLAYRSLDAAGNEEAVRTAQLGVLGDANIAAVTTLEAVASVPPLNGYTSGEWTVSLSCSVTGAPGAACLGTEYSVDSGPFITYQAPFVISQPGNHVVRYWSFDVLGRQELAKTVTLGVLRPDTTPPISFIRLASTGARALFDQRTMGSWIVALDGCSDTQFVPVGQQASGCARTEFRVDGGAFQPFDQDVVISEIGVHRFEYRSIDVAGNAEFPREQVLEVVAPSDLDGDGLLDYADNCHLLANPDQRDTDDDLYGNRCDADFNQNGTVDSNDASLLRARLGSSAAAAPDQDLDGNGAVDTGDVNLLKAQFRKPPGPAYGYDVIEGD
jgi:hypothetical protein